MFVDVGSDTMAVTGLLALSGVGAGALYLRRRYTIDPVAAYRLAMYRLNTHPGLLEVRAWRWRRDVWAVQGVAVAVWP